MGNATQIGARKLQSRRKVCESVLNGTGRIRAADPLPGLTDLRYLTLTLMDHTGTPPHPRQPLGHVFRAHARAH